MADAATIGRDTARAGLCDAARRFINDAYPGRGRLLEIGSGLGFLLAAYKADGWRVHGIDADEQHCRYAREQHRVAAHGVALLDARIPDEAFDIVVVSDPSTDRLAVLPEVNRILRPGGHCLIDLSPPGPLAWRRRAPAGHAPGFRAVHTTHAGGRGRRLIAAVSRRLGVAGPPGIPTPCVWLQKIAPCGPEARLGVGHAARRAAVTERLGALPLWLCQEVAGVITAESARPSAARASRACDIRRGYPWRIPEHQVAASAGLVTPR